MIEKASGYRARLAEIRQRGGKSWSTPPALREEITAWGRGLQSSGYRVSWIAREIGLSESAFRRWLNSGKEETGFLPVTLGSSEKVNRAENLSLVSPGGYRLEGLSLSDAIDVFRQL
jgi:transposase-like protein